MGYDNGERILEERYLYCLLLEYAATLSLIDVALIPPARARGDCHGMWGTDELVHFSRYDGLMFFRITTLGAYCLGAESEYQPAPVETKPVLRVLPNLEIAAIGAELEQGDRLPLDAYATKVSDLVWRLDAASSSPRSKRADWWSKSRSFCRHEAAPQSPTRSPVSSRMLPIEARRFMTAASPASSNVPIPRSLRSSPTIRGRASTACEPGNGTW